MNNARGGSTDLALGEGFLHGGIRGAKPREGCPGHRISSGRGRRAGARHGEPARCAICCTLRTRGYIQELREKEEFKRRGRRNEGQ